MTEPYTDHLKQAIHALVPSLQRIVNVYGFTEAMGPGVAVECPIHGGLHLWEDHFYAEIIDPTTLALVPDGQEGELVITTYFREAHPLLRYRTFDRTKILSREPCECGIPFLRLSEILGRVDDAIFIDSCLFYPSDLDTILPRFDALIRPSFYQIVVVNPQGSLHHTNSDVTIRIEARYPADESPTAYDAISSQIFQLLDASFIGFSRIKVLIVAPGELSSVNGAKMQRVVRLLAA